MAPKDMVLWGLVDNATAIRNFHLRVPSLATINPPAAIQTFADAVVPHDKSSPRPFFAPFASFQYDPRLSNNVQTFSIRREIHELSLPTSVVVLEIKSNWGHEDFTCLCRLRIHGRLL
ncbi:hypothetical protein BD410DRAFT_844810 [Rickenella mellea]|uniref:SUN domain-containing protein n=1 Tax=Rickenella mellea TaxID=50990 RepID=A0A4Y7PL08_9AGAM|nr:hypothetical protein BD410DRAFT_844810 [Rickenella mellea]